MKRVLLTGAGGAVGIHILAHIMHNTDWFVVCTDSFKMEHKGYYDRLVRVCRDHPNWNKRIKIIIHDLITPFSDREIEQIGEIDYIINLASKSDVQASIDDPFSTLRNNNELILTMLDYTWRAWDLKNPNHPPLKDKVFLQFSTDEVYGATPKDSGGHKEWESIIPSNPYSASKVGQEADCTAFWRSYGLPLIITNTMNNFGEMQAPSKFPAMIQSKIEKDEIIPVHISDNEEIGTRYYIHSRNVADAVLYILKNIKPTLHGYGELDLPERLNIVGDKQVSNLELVKLIGKLMGKEPKYELKTFHKYNPGHDLHYGLNGSKLKELGWTSPLPFEESMKNTIEWQQRNPEWIK